MQSVHSVLVCLAIGFLPAASAQDTSQPAADATSGSDRAALPDKEVLQREFKRQELNPQARVAVLQGVDFYKAKDYPKAINAFKAAVRMHPKYGPFHHLLGAAYYRNRQGGQAWLEFRKAVLLNPRDPRALRDFQSTWALFDRRGVFAAGRSQQQIAELIGAPDGRGQNEEQEVWQYGYMRLQFVKGHLLAVVDPRGLDGKLQKPVDSVVAKFDDRARWKLGQRAINRLHSISEYVPKEESVRDWNEMVQVQRLFQMAEQQTAQELMAKIRERLQQGDKQLQFAVIASSDAEVLFHWNTPGGKDRPPQHEIVRLVRGDRDIHRLAYTRRAAQIPQQDAQKWLTLIRSAKLTKQDVQSSAAASE